MHIIIQHSDGSRTAFFGISDFENHEGDETVEIAFHSDVNLDADRMYRIEQGTIETAASETSYNKEGAYGAISDIAVEDKTEVIVGVTERYPWIAHAAKRLSEEDDFGGDLKIIE